MRLKRFDQYKRLLKGADPLSDEIERLRNLGKRYIPPKTGAGFYAAIQDARLTKEHVYELNKGNVCPVCRILKSKRGECMC